ncbi:DUF5119 domain-containing protein [Dysgonomonas sp. 520]|uniref:DUF5119 domain-containing protein n=1 Tax=Dysgonomonas sp. 520 TaxID=2302931 RepID=UPI0013D1007F|nr:DUF5119 domain-containing protein [Dysgonomonas sp. 520]NDW08363.1 DUF5119 domain-containing protein [Dysgonomonas sp. 520]
MRNILFLFILALLTTVSCKNKSLCDAGLCVEGDVAIKVVVNWEDQADVRVMRMNIFSQTSGVIDYGRNNIPISGEKMIKLVTNASYIPLCYDNNSNVSLRNETTLESFQAYCAETSRQTYNLKAMPVSGEKTVIDPKGDFFVHSWQETFDVIFCNECEDFLILNFYPKNILREFTYRINGISGTKNIAEARGAISGMAATYFFKTDELTTERSTVLFENSTVGIDENGVGYIEGSFYTFGPVYPYQNRFTIEILSKINGYYTAYWDVSGQIGESMADREAKLQRDGYDILIENKDEIPEIPEPGGNPGDGGGFEIGVGEWDNVDVYL